MNINRQFTKSQVFGANSIGISTNEFLFSFEYPITYVHMLSLLKPFDMIMDAIKSSEL